MTLVISSFDCSSFCIVIDGQELKCSLTLTPYPPHRFGELKCNPAKAKKPHHRPKEAKEFAEKYMQGYYSIVEDAMEQPEQASADSKEHK